jgi:hypothetical protein
MPFEKLNQIIQSFSKPITTILALKKRYFNQTEKFLVRFHKKNLRILCLGFYNLGIKPC